MPLIDVGCNALQIVFLLLIFLGIVIRLNRIEKSIGEIDKK